MRDESYIIFTKHFRERLLLRNITISKVYEVVKHGRKKRSSSGTAWYYLGKYAILIEEKARKAITCFVSSKFSIVNGEKIYIFKKF